MGIPVRQSSHPPCQVRAAGPEDACVGVGLLPAFHDSSAAQPIHGLLWADSGRLWVQDPLNSLASRPCARDSHVPCLSCMP